jgi:hypothetical protein
MVVEIIRGDYNERNRHNPFEVRLNFGYGRLPVYTLMGNGTVQQVTADLLEIVTSGRGLILRDELFHRVRKLPEATRIVSISKSSGVIRAYRVDNEDASRKLCIKKAGELMFTSSHGYLFRK